MFKAILAALAAIPEIVGLLRELVQGIQGMIAEQRRQRLIAQFRAGITEANETFDTSKLEDAWKFDRG